MTKYTPEEKPGRLLTLHEKVSRIVQSLAGSAEAEVPEKPDDSIPVAAAEVSEEAVNATIHAWRERARYLPGELLSDPAWGILLELLQAEVEDRRVSLSRLHKASAVSATSAVRWLKALESRHLVVRRPDPNDSRNEFVELAPKASSALRRYFRDVIQDPRNSMVQP